MRLKVYKRPAGDCLQVARKPDYHRLLLLSSAALSGVFIGCDQQNTELELRAGNRGRIASTFQGDRLTCQSARETSAIERERAR